MALKYNNSNRYEYNQIIVQKHYIWVSLIPYSMLKVCNNVSQFLVNYTHPEISWTYASKASGSYGRLTGSLADEIQVNKKHFTFLYGLNDGHLKMINKDAMYL